ncbi:uncharacterized protein EV422DRAFT_523244 [Fimicolochytrium jonesii]|uniref:uncharacterized protein n=1 Tax=Fimicolochytrium jonesii TaxID=1396493 RepID=UPI0022FDB48F|nr:uncharacterized protein EV422DRAFT_523244 [Fimicolochytrium jonesii]KAI8823071.1 hypothetical protein EV422DRAFT_523244 [Fimicolochytrium jonesii]
MFSNNPKGVRAQPKTLRPPSTLSNLTSYIGGLSSYVVQNLPEKLNWNPQSEPCADDVNPSDFEQETVLTAAFCWVDWEIPGVVQKLGRKRRLCLLLGYPAGFQIWDVSDTDNVQEVASFRGIYRDVGWIQAVPDPLTRESAQDKFKASRPLVALIADVDSQNSPRSKAAPIAVQSTRVLQLFSMSGLQPVKTLDFGSSVPLEARCTARALAVVLNSNTIQVFSSLTLQKLATFGDVASTPLHDGAVFDLGLRYIIYATSTLPPTKTTATLRGGDQLDSDESDELKEMGVARKVAGKVAKELVIGAKVLGEYGYQALNSYLAPKPGAKAADGDGDPRRSMEGERQPRPRDKMAASSASSGRGEQSRLAGATGVVIVHRIPSSASGVSDSSPTNFEPMQAIAHWKPHSNPVSVIHFNPNQSLVLTASTQANAFYLWEVPSNSAKGIPKTSARCIYKLERGYTMATIEDIAFSLDSRWIGVTTARGTTHVYHIEPLERGKRKPGGVMGGPPSADERLNLINGVLETGGAMPSHPETEVQHGSGVPSLYPVARIKRQVAAETGRRQSDASSSIGSPTDTGSHLTLPHANGHPHGLLLAAFLPEDRCTPEDRAGRSRRSSNSRLPSADRNGSSGSGSWGALRNSYDASGFPKSCTISQVSRQGLLTFQSAGQGILMIHHMDVILETFTGPQHTTNTLSPSPGSHGSGQKSFLGNLSSSPLERFSPSGFLSSAFPGLTLGTAASKKSHLRVKVSDVLEWAVNRETDWAEVKYPIQPRTVHPNRPSSGTKPASSKGGKAEASEKKWLSKIEIRTFHPSLRPPVWTGPQFVFQVYDTTARASVATAPHGPKPDLSDLPSAVELKIRREAPKPYGEERSRPSGHFPVLDRGDGIQDDITAAIGSNIEFTPYKLDSLHAYHDSLSFEDADLIQLPHEPPFAQLHASTHSHHTNSSHRTATPVSGEDVFVEAPGPNGLHETGENPSHKFVLQCTPPATASPIPNLPRNPRHTSTAADSTPSGSPSSLAGSMSSWRG